MRQLFIASIFLGILPADAFAVPFAEYNPTNGDLAFHNARGVRQLLIYTPFEFVNPNLATLPMELTPPDATPPTVILQPGWLMPNGEPFDFDVLTVRGVIVPRTPVNLLRFRYDTGGVAPNLGTITVVPEPSAIALSACGLFAVAAIRRRLVA